MNSFYTQAGKRIRNLREDRGYTREELSELAEISSKFLYEIETGQKGFSADTLFRVSRVLGVTCDFLLTGTMNDNIVPDLSFALSRFNENDFVKLAEIIQLISSMKADLKPVTE